MKNNKIIAFTGGMGCGKSTAIAQLRTPGSNPVLVKFAGPIYDIQDYVYDRIQSAYTRPPSFIKDRKLLQWIGTDWGRGTIRDSLWVDLWVAEVTHAREMSDPAQIIVCDDCRFDNESDAVRSLGGAVVKISSTRAKERIDTAAGIRQHASEAGLDASKIDYEVENNGTLEEFYKKLDDLYEELGLVNNKRKK